MRDFMARLRLPVVVAPMFLVSGPEMVIAACKAGLVGSFPAPNCRTAEELDAWMTQISAAVGPEDAPWAANLVALVARHKPPLVITALGSPKPAIELVHSYGGLVMADVTNVALGRKAAAAGADGLVCVSAGAGGHTGQLSPFAFIAALRQFFPGLVCVGGGIADGAGVAGAVTAGADLVYMGTRFIAAEESLASPAYKAMLAACSIEDLVVSNAVTGTAASWLKPSLAAAGYDLAGGPVARDYGGDVQKRWKDVWSAGQGLHAVTGIEPMAAIAATLEREFDAAVAGLKARAAGLRR
jgi:nitronate monooxygenase